MLVSFLAGYELGDMGLGNSIGSIYTIIFFTAKDCFLDHGTRSIGKKLMKLEVVNKQGELSGPYRNLFRNTLELCMAGTFLLGVPYFSANTGLVLLDYLSLLLFKRRIFDFMLGTRTVRESPDHALVSLSAFSEESRVKLFKDKIAYKRQSELLEEASMSNMQQMLKQQQEYEKVRQELEARKKEKH